MRFFIITYFLFLLTACGTSDGDKTITPTENNFASEADIQKILSLYDSIDPKHPGDWLLTNPEKYISFNDYKNNDPVKGDNIRNVIYIKPIGFFDTTKYNLVDMAAQFLSAVYHKQVRVLPA